MRLSKADASKLLTLKTWADASGANLKKLDAADVKQAVKATGVSAADVKRLAAASSTFTKADFAALAKQNSLAGDSASKAPIQQREVFGVGEKKSKLTEAGVAFWHSPYTNEDAKVVMKQKGLPDLRAAKDFIGHAILTKGEGELQSMGVTRYLFDEQDSLSRFRRSSFTEADVRQAKKEFPFLKDSSLDEVRGYLGLKLRNKESGYLGGMEMLAEHGITESKYDNHDQLDAFKRGGFTDAQVKRAVEKFDFLQGIPVRQVKEYLGLKVLNAKDGYDFAADFLKQIGHGGAARA